VRTRVKICGCTSVADAVTAIEAGADAVGVILAERSPRRVPLFRLAEIALHIPAFVTLVAVFVDPPSSLVDEALKVGAIPQFHGDEPAEACESFAAGPYLKAYHVRDEDAVSPAVFDAYARPYEHATWLFDTAANGAPSGGTGRTFDWEIVPRLRGDRAVVVSGGLTPENVGTCVRVAQPYAVDVRSGVETGGVKDRAKIRAFIEAVRDADAALLA
jgi:phosphoribosylanthranilate isomerase